MPEDEEGYEEEVAGEDGMGEVPKGDGWDEAGDVPDEEEDALMDDDIKDWD